MTVADQAAQGAGIGQPFAGAGIEPGAPTEVVEAVEGLSFPRLDDACSRLLAQAAIFDSGRPLVIAPRTGSRALPRRALVAWDGTHAAARAMQDALSILSAGAEALVARVTDDKELRMDQSGIEAAHHLSRHGIKAEFRDIPRQGRDIYDALLATAHDSNCDLIVTGAVRHSPIHELIFGSVTGKDPRSLGELECSAFELGLSRAEAKSLQQVAFDQLAASTTMTPAPKEIPARAQAQRCAH